ncbi:MAG: M28 family peptidase [Planctomycetota bacterium]|jgi:hypothetical protein
MIRLLFVALVLVCSTASGQTADELQAHVEFLADDALEGRYPASPGMKKAVEYVRAECKAIGLQTYKQPVSVRGGTCENMIAVLDGRDTETRIVIGAHLDHIGSRDWRGKKIIYNGADDNASGSAAVLGLAKRLAAGPKPPCTVEFHFYTGEEQGLLGSKVYVKKSIAPIEQYKFMLNLDMIGRLGSKKLIGQQSPLDLSAILEPLYTKYIFAKKITWASDTADSDHSSWWRAGVPAVILHTGLHSDYHQGGDEADRIDYEGMEDVCEYAHDIILAVYRALDYSVVDQPDSPYVLH